MTLEVGVRLRADGKGLVGELRLSERELNRLGATTRKTGQDANKASSEVNRFGNESKKAAAGAKQLNTEAQGAGKSLNVLKTLLPSIGMAVFTQQVISAGLAMTKMRNSLLAVTGSTEAAQAELDFIRDTADRLGLSFESLAGAYTRFNAASAGTALEGENTRKVFVSVASAARVLGLSADETEGAMRALQQMMSKGTVQAEELRGQLSERIPGAFNIAARAMGVTTKELGKMLEQGEVLAADLLPRLADELMNTYGGAVNAASQSAGAAFARLETAMFSLRAEVAESGFMEGLAESTMRLVDALNSPEAIAAAQKLGAAMGVLAENLDLVAIALGGIVARGLLTKMAAGMTAVAAAGVSMTGAVAALGGPAGIAILATTGIVAYMRSLEDAGEASKLAAEEQAKYNALVTIGGDAALEAARKTLQAKKAELTALFEKSEGFWAQLFGPTGGMVENTRNLIREIEILEDQIGALEQGLSAVVTMSDEGLGKFVSGFRSAKQEADDAGKAVREFLDSMEAAAEYDAMSDRDKAGVDAWNDAMKAGVPILEENERLVKAVARAIHDEKEAREKATEATKAQAKAIAEAEEARMAELSAIAEVEAAGWAQDERVREFEMNQRIERRQTLQQNADALAQSLETESERIKREYTERNQILDQAQAEGLTIIGGYERARTLLHAEMLEELTALEQDQADQYEEIWNNMVQGMQSAFTDAIYNGLFEDGIDSWSDFVDTMKELWKRMIAEMISAWVTSGIAGLLSGKGFSGFNIGAITGGGNALGGIGGLINGGGIGGGGIPGLGSIGAKIAGWFGGGSAASAGAFGAGAAVNPATMVGGLGGGGGGLGALAGGMAIPASIFGGVLLGSSILGSRDRKEAARFQQNEFAPNFDAGNVEQLANGTFLTALEDVRGELDAIYVAIDSQVMQALKDAGVATQALSMGFEENGNEVRRIVGDVDAVKAALEDATITGYKFGGSLETAIEKGNGLAVSINGNAEEIKAALQAATEAGIGGFRNLEVTEQGVTATLTGDIAQWQKYLDEVVAKAYAIAGGMLSVGDNARASIGGVMALANATAQIGSTSNVTAGRQYMGLPRVPRDEYPAILHKGETVLTRAQTDALERELQPKGGDDGSQSAALLSEMVGLLQRSVAAQERAVRYSLADSRR